MASNLTEGQTIGIMVGVSLLGIIAGGAYKYNSVVEEKRQAERILAQEANTKTQAKRRKISDDRAKKNKLMQEEASIHAAVEKQMHNQKIERVKNARRAFIATARKEATGENPIEANEAAGEEPVRASGRLADILGSSSITRSIFSLLPETFQVPIIGSLNTGNQNTGNRVVNPSAVEIIRKGEFIKSPPFIIGTSHETYNGYRKITCEDWNKITFRQYFVDFYKDNKGIENKMTKEPESTMLVFGRSKPIVNDCQIEVVNVTTKSKCQLSYCNREITGLKCFNLDNITPELIHNSTCYDSKNNSYGYLRLTSVHHVQLLAPKTIFPCLFVHDNVTVGARRSSRKRTQKKR